MNQKRLLLGALVIVLAIAGWWFLKDRFGQDGENVNMLAGTVVSIDRVEESFVMNVLSEVEAGDETDIRDINYTVSWDDDTKFYAYRSSLDVDENRGDEVQSGELGREKAIDVQTREKSGTERTAQIIWIYPNVPAAQPQTEQSEPSE